MNEQELAAYYQGQSDGYNLAKYVFVSDRYWWAIGAFVVGLFLGMFLQYTI